MSTPENMISYTEEVKDDVLVMRLQGRLNTLTSLVIEQQVLNHIAKSQNKLLLNLSSVDYISSLGLKVLLSLSRKAKSSSGKLIVCEIPPFVQEILKITGIYRGLVMAKNEEEALQAMREIN